MQDSSKAQKLTLSPRDMAMGVTALSLLSSYVVLGSLLFQEVPITRSILNAVACAIAGIMSWLCYFLVCRKFDFLGLMSIYMFAHEIIRHGDRPFLKTLAVVSLSGTTTACLLGVVMRFVQPRKPANGSSDPPDNTAPEERSGSGVSRRLVVCQAVLWTIIVGVFGIPQLRPSRDIQILRSLLISFSIASPVLLLAIVIVYQIRKKSTPSASHPLSDAEVS